MEAFGGIVLGFFCGFQYARMLYSEAVKRDVAYEQVQKIAVQIADAVCARRAANIEKDEYLDTLSKAYYDAMLAYTEEKK